MMPTQSENDGKFDGNKLSAISPKNSMLKKYILTLRTVLPRLESVEKCAVFIIYNVPVRVPFSKSAGVV